MSSLRDYREEVLAGKYYWAHRNPQFLELVYETALPPDTEREALVAWGERYEYNWRTPGLSGAYFVDQARVLSPKKKKRKRSPLEGPNTRIDDVKRRHNIVIGGVCQAERVLSCIPIL